MSTKTWEMLSGCHDAVLRENFKYSSFKDIHEYLETKFHDHKQKWYYGLHPVDIHNIRTDMGSFETKDCMKSHMIFRKKSNSKSCR